MCDRELLRRFGRGLRAEGRGLSSGAVASVGATIAARVARGCATLDSGAGGTGANRLTRLTWLAGLVLLSRSEALLNGRRLIFDGIPDEFPILVLFPGLVNLERGLIDRAPYSVDERPENGPADGPSGLELRQRSQRLVASGGRAGLLRVLRLLDRWCRGLGCKARDWQSKLSGRLSLLRQRKRPSVQVEQSHLL